MLWYTDAAPALVANWNLHGHQHEASALGMIVCIEH